MINLFNINNYVIDTSSLGNHLHGPLVKELEDKFCEYVGAKYGCAVNSATNAIFLALKDKATVVEIPTMIPPVVGNAVHLAGCELRFSDDTYWVGHSYTLHDFKDYKIIDSAQRVDKDQFAEEANDDDIMIFSFYPTKPVGGIDGGMIVSNDKDKIDYFKHMSFNGMSFAENNWEREQVSIGWKMYLNSVQAYVALSNLRKLETKKYKLAEVREKYNNAFGLNNSSDHLYRISVNNRDELQGKLKQKNIVTGIHYSCLHQNPLFACGLALPNSEIQQNKVLSLPYHEGMTPDNVEEVIWKVKQLAKF